MHITIGVQFCKRSLLFLCCSAIIYKWCMAQHGQREVSLLPSEAQLMAAIEEKEKNNIFSCPGSQHHFMCVDSFQFWKGHAMYNSEVGLQKPAKPSYVGVKMSRPPPHLQLVSTCYMCHVTFIFQTVIQNLIAIHLCT